MRGRRKAVAAGEDGAAHDDPVSGFIGSCQGASRRRSNVQFYNAPHFYPGEPTQAMLDDPQLRIVAADGPGDHPTIEEGMAEARAKEDERTRQLQELGAPKFGHTDQTGVGFREIH